MVFVSFYPGLFTSESLLRFEQSWLAVLLCLRK